MPPRIPPPTSVLPLPSPHTHCILCLRRSFSSTPRVDERAVASTKNRQYFWAWINTAGKNFVEPQKGFATNYLTSYNSSTDYKERRKNLGRGGSERRQRRSTDGEETADSQALAEAAIEDATSEVVGHSPAQYPYPMNRAFKSEAILSEALRLEVWKRVQVDGHSVRQVSADLNIDMRRVGAVVRLVEVEKRMRAEGRELALPYAEAIHLMVPITKYKEGSSVHHEGINDLPVHSMTTPQLFYPTSESRAFNRTDAGRVFSAAPRLPDSQDVGQGGAPLNEPWQDTKIEIIGKRGHEQPVLKPADARIPHSHLIKYEQEKRDPQLNHNLENVHQRYVQRLHQDKRARELAKAAKAAAEESNKTRVHRGKWQFVVTDVQAEKGVGRRYGVPSQDRKRGAVKIPTRVEV